MKEVSLENIHNRTTKPTLVLASSSTQRVNILKRMGYNNFDIFSPDIDETPLKKEKAKNLALRLAKEKAGIISLKFPDKLILAADTVCIARGIILPKATNKEEAMFCISKLSGRRHRTITAVCGIYKKRVIAKVSTTILKMKLLTQHEIKEILDQEDNWMNKAGGFSLQGTTSKFIEWISGSDSGVMGLPCYETYCILNSLGL